MLNVELHNIYCIDIDKCPCHVRNFPSTGRGWEGTPISGRVLREQEKLAERSFLKDHVPGAMTSSYINEPFTLATYASTSRSKTYIPGIFVSLHKKSNDEYATVATNGDGVHVLDVSVVCYPIYIC